MGNPEGTTRVCYNGEIYNHRDLRRSLEAKGHAFRTRCDTEALVHLYDEYGPEMLDHLTGMFAFGLYDTRRRRLLLARDRLGQKPLYYFFSNGTLAFASEMQALIHAPGCPRDIRPQSVHDYLTYQYIPAPYTIYRNVWKLPPASRLVVTASAPPPQPKRYWQPDFATKTDLSFRESAELLDDAVQARLMSDVPLGAFLSGGIDSSVVVALMARRTGRPVRTFTIGFSDRKYDERMHGQTVARRYDTEHHTRVVDPRDFETVRRLVRHYGEPYSDASMLPTALLAAFTREQVTVALSGDGADEIFGGYYRYLVMGWTRLFDLLPLPMRRRAARMLLHFAPSRREERTMVSRVRRILQLAESGSHAERYHDLITRFPELLKQSVYGPALKERNLTPSRRILEHAFRAATARDPVEQVAEVDLHTYLPGDILTKVDIASMTHSLEVRSPFLDHRVVEFSASLPWGFKQQGFQRKRVLLGACDDLLPPSVRNRPKMGFGVPLARWFRSDWEPLLREILLDPVSEGNGFFSREGVEALLREHCQLKADRSYGLWALLIFQLWYAEFHNAQ